MTDNKTDAQKYAEGLAEALIGKLGLLLMQEFQLIWGLRADVVLLRDDAAMMNALLRMFSEADQDVVDHFVREWMTQVRELAYDGEDCIDIFLRRISWSPRSTNFFLGTWHQISTIYPRSSLGNDIKALRARAIAISERRGRYGVYGQALQPSVAFGSRIPMTSMPPPGLRGANNDPSQFVGMEDHIQSLSKILHPPATLKGKEKEDLTLTPVDGGDTDKTLKAKEKEDLTLNPVDGGDTDKTLKVCSIVGIGGVGKSTLALRVFASLQKHFKCRAVVSVSQQYDLGGLIKDIHKEFGYKEGEVIMNEGSSMMDGFKDHLKGKRYLIVLDDVWTTSAWDAIRAKLPENNEHSRIIVTTRIENVARRCSTPSPDGRYIHHANFLNDKDSKTLFVTRVFGQPNLNAVAQPIPDAVAAAKNDGQHIPDAPAAAQNDGCPEELEDKMDIILKKCGGLPLAIVCIANVLASYNSPTSVEMWRRVCNSVGSQLETNSALEGMMRIIALSYNHLPHPLKACAMLLSIFPQGYHIPKWRLVRRWISEGLVPEKRGLSLLDVAEAYYDELLSRNIIQIAVFPNGKVSEGHCRVHDIMYEVILNKSVEENFVSLEGSTSKGTSCDPVRRLCIHGDVGYVADGRSMKHVRSFTTFGAKKNHGIGQLLDGLPKCWLLFHFTKKEFTLLRVLDLEDCKDVTDGHMKQVCRLLLLRLLNLNGTNITELPREISNLKHLQSLMLYNALLEVVPESVSNLEKLEYLSFQKRGNDAIKLKLPKGLQKMKALQQLTRLQIGKNDTKLVKEIGDLAQLRVLGVYVLWDCSEDLRSELQRSIAKLKLCSLRGEADVENQPRPNTRR